jgi:hypothetical protein
MARRIIESWRIDYNGHRPTRASAASHRTSSQPGPDRTTTRTDSGYERGHSGGKVKAKKCNEDLFKNGRPATNGIVCPPIWQSVGNQRPLNRASANAIKGALELMRPPSAAVEERLFLSFRLGRPGNCLCREFRCKPSAYRTPRGFKSTPMTSGSVSCRMTR